MMYKSTYTIYLHNGSLSKLGPTKLELTKLGPNTNPNDNDNHHHNNNNNNNNNIYLPNIATHYDGGTARLWKALIAAHNKKQRKN